MWDLIQISFGTIIYAQMLTAPWKEKLCIIALHSFLGSLEAFAVRLVRDNTDKNHRR